MKEIMGNRLHYLSAIAIVALVLIGVFSASRPITVQTNTSPTAKTIQVSGVGSVSATPDETLLSLAVVTQSVTATQATQDNAVTMTKVIQSLISFGLASDSLKTVSYSLTPIYDTNHDVTPPKVVGYSARNAIQVILSNVSLTGKALDIAIAAGANEVDSITFTFTAQTFATLQKQALQLAIQDASGQAQAMASNLNVRIVGPRTVSTGYTSPSPVVRLSANAQTPIQPGSLQVSANVQVTYEFVPV
jgi:hypothetical protein